jgi:hypothetical protein
MWVCRRVGVNVCVGVRVCFLQLSASSQSVLADQGWW